MAYYIMINKGKKFEKIDITALNSFTRMSKYKDKNTYSLEEIDFCTSKYKSEIEFKIDLITNGSLLSEDINKTLSIRSKNKDKLIKVKYDLAYSEASRFLDLSFLRYYILRKASDRDFLIKLLAYYRNSYCNNENINKIRYLLNVGNNPEFDMYSTLNDFFIRQVYNTDYKTGVTTLKYKSLHDLAMFCYNYELGIISKNIHQEKIELPKKKVLKKSKQDKEIEGQLSFNDL